MSVVFISHPFTANPKENMDRVSAIACRLAIEGHVPFAPQLFLPLFLDETTERHIALRICLKLVSLADKLHIYGEISEGMTLEIQDAISLGIPVVNRE